MDTQTKEWIDHSSYEILLKYWRFAVLGDIMLQGEIGKYYSKVMFAKRDALADGGVSASKNVGWNQQ